MKHHPTLLWNEMGRPDTGVVGKFIICSGHLKGIVNDFAYN